MAGAERDHLDADDLARGDDVPEVERDDMRGEQVEIALLVRLLIRCDAAHDRDVVDALRGMRHGNALDLHARDEAAGIDQEIVGATVAVRMRDGEAAPETLDDKGGLGAFALQFGMGKHLISPLRHGDTEEKYAVLGTRYSEKQ